MPFDISPNDADLLVAIDERLLRSILWTLVDDGTINLIQTLSDGSVVTILGFDIRLKPRPGGAAIGLTFSASVDSTQSSSGPNACDGMVWASAVVPLVTMFAPNFRQTIAASFSGVDLADVSTQGFGRDLFCSEQVRQGAWLALRGFGTIPLMPGIAARRFELDVLTTADDRRLLVVGAELPSEWGGGRLDMRRLSIPIDRDDTIWVYVGGQIIVGAAWQLLRRVSRSDFIRDAVEEESSGAPDQEKTYATDLIQAQMDSRGGWLPTVVYRPETYWLEIVSPNGKKFRIDEAHLFSDLDADGVADYRETPLELVITSNKNIPQQIAVQPGDSLSITTSLGGHGAVAFGGAGVLSLPSGLSERIDIPGLSFEYVDSRLRIRLAVPAGDPHRWLRAGLQPSRSTLDD
ncbi:MAG: hypothetical protein KC609_08590 [Myxococcales bacterium]|nr:hypothetical protein [Myxococcales bacterium]